MDSKVIRLFDENNLIFLATIMKDGSPQVTPVWGEFENEHVLINTAEGRIKYKNILRDPRVSICLVSKNNPLDMVTIKGKVVKINPDYQYEHIIKLTKKYMNLDYYPFRQENEKRIILKIKPNKVFILPELSFKK